MSRYAPDCRFLCQSSSMEFLSNHNFDFNKLFKHGIYILLLYIFIIKIEISTLKYTKLVSLFSKLFFTYLKTMTQKKKTISANQ